jgi:hypothetical protein
MKPLRNLSVGVLSLALGSTIAGCGGPTVPVVGPNGECLTAAQMPKNVDYNERKRQDCWGKRMASSQTAGREAVKTAVTKNERAKNPGANVAVLKAAVGPVSEDIVNQAIAETTNFYRPSNVQNATLEDVFSSQEPALRLLRNAGLSVPQQVDVQQEAATQLGRYINDYGLSGNFYQEPEYLDDWIGMSVASTIETGLKTKELSPEQALALTDDITNRIYPKNKQDGRLLRYRMQQPLVAVPSTLPDPVLAAVARDLSPTGNEDVFNEVWKRKMDDTRFIMIQNTGSLSQLAKFGEGLAPQVVERFVIKHLELSRPEPSSLTTQSCNGLKALRELGLLTKRLTVLQKAGCVEPPDKARALQDQFQELTKEEQGAG